MGVDSQKTSSTNSYLKPGFFMSNTMKKFIETENQDPAHSMAKALSASSQDPVAKPLNPFAFRSIDVTSEEMSKRT